METPTERTSGDGDARPQTHYGVLGVGRGAATGEIRAAWKQLARRLHPDVGGDPAEFDRALKAYETLSDRYLRNGYDLDLAKAQYCEPPREPSGRTTSDPHRRWRRPSRPAPRVAFEQRMREARLRHLNDRAFDEDGNLRTMGPPPPRPRASRSPGVVLAAVATAVVAVALFVAVVVTVYNQLPLPGSPANGW